jgi:hypothetical protein
MFESIELPHPEDVAGLDDVGLLDAMAVAAVVETAAIDVRFSAIEEIYRRNMAPVVGSGSTPPPPHAALPSSRRRSRKARKRRNRRR